MRTLVLLFLCISLSNVAKTQNCFIEGPQDIECAFDQFYTYTLFCDSIQEFEIFNWSIVPEEQGAEIVWTRGNTAEVMFYNDGTYELCATYYDFEKEDTLRSCIPIFVFGQPNDLLFDSCVTRNPLNGCYQVCENSTSIIRVFNNDGNGRWSVSGARNVNDFGEYVEILWGDAGRGSVVYESACGPISACIDILDTPIPSFNTIPSGSDPLVVCRNQEIFFENTSENALNYEWNFGNGDQAETFDATYSYAEAGIYTVTLKASSICNCTEEITKTIEVLDAPAPTLDCVNSVCPETRQMYTATTDGCNEYVWNISDNGTVINGGGINDDFIEVIWHEGPDGIIELSVSDCATAYCSFTNSFRVPIITPDGPLEGDVSVCSGEMSQYTAPYFPGTTYSWSTNFGGVVMSGQNTNAAVIQWPDVNAPTVVQVVLAYENCFLECGGEDILEVQVTPTISLNADEQVCFGEEATASALAGFSSPGPAPVEWEIQDATGNTLFTAGLSPDITVTFNYPPGEYFWVAVNNSGDYCNELITSRITVTPTPDQPISITGETSICPGTAYGYTIENAGNFATLWDITDGTDNFTYEGQSISHTFVNNPPYVITARHRDIQYPDCLSEPIVLNARLGADTEIQGIDTVCFESISSYSIPAIGGALYSWSVIPASAGNVVEENMESSSIFWSASGNATLRLEVCGEILEKNVFVQARPVFNIIGNLTTCGNTTTEIYSDAEGLRHTWRNEDDMFISANDTVNLLPGYYSLEVTDQYGCSTREAFRIIELPFPAVSLTSPVLDFFCGDIPDGIPLVANTDEEDYVFTWYQDGIAVGSGPTYTATAFGVYQVEAINEFGCTALSSPATIGECCPVETCLDTVVGNPGGCTFLPFDFNITTDNVSCSEKIYTPTATELLPGSGRWKISTISDGYLGGAISDVFNFSYDLPGYYRVVFNGKLDAFSYPNANCTHHQIFLDTVRLVADFNVQAACVNTTVEIEDLTTFIPGENVVGWSWDFGDPASGGDNTSTDQNPSHVFNTPGTYTITLVATASSGCTSRKTQDIIISGGPTLDVVYDPVHCEGSGVTFAIDENIFNPMWNFGDPASGALNTANEKDVSHLYGTPGIFTVSITAEDIYGCLNDNSVDVDIRENNLAGDITIDPSNVICQGDQATLTAPSGGISWDWTTGASTENIVVSTADQYGVTIRDENNCSYTPPAVFINVNPKPVIEVKGRIIYGPGEFGPWTTSLAVCDNIDFELRVFSTQALNYTWSTGSNNEVLVFSGDGGFPDPGTEIFTVDGIDPLTGCVSETASFTVEIFEVPSTPVIALTSGSACSFDDNELSVQSPDMTLNYIWSDGQTGTTITVSEGGLYTVKAINSNGCIAESGVYEIIKAAPVDLIPGGCFDACNPLTVCLPDINNVASYTIFKDGAVFDAGNVLPDNYVIDMDGSYEIEVTTLNGCTAISEPLNIILYDGVGTLTIEVWVDVDRNGTISAADTLIQGIPVVAEHLTDTQIGEAVTEMDGGFDFVDFQTGNYLGRIHKEILSSEWIVIVDSLQNNIATCDDSTSISLLIAENCKVVGDTIRETLCPGNEITIDDSTWTDVGNYSLHYLASNGCDSVVTVEITPYDSVTIAVKAYMDLDERGDRSSADTLLPSIRIILENRLTGTMTSDSLDENGCYVRTVERSDYLIYTDLTTLNPLYETVVDSLFISADSCGAISELYLLFKPACQDVLIVDGDIICFGDSVLINGVWETEANVYTYPVSDPASLCDTIMQFTLEVLPELSVTSSVESSCGSDGTVATITLDVDGEGPFQYVWNPAVSTDSIAENVGPGNYTVQVTDRNACSTTAFIRVDPIDTLSFSLQSVYQIESGESVELDIMGDINEPGLIVAWSPSDNLSCSDCFNPTASPTETTTYIADIMDPNGCSYVLFTTVQVLPDDSCSLEFFLDEEVFVFEGDTIQLSIVGDTDVPGVSVSWNPTDFLGCPDCFVTTCYPEQNTIYTATITDSSNCVYELTTLVNVLQDTISFAHEIFMPNAFTPNESSLNDRFKIMSHDPEATLLQFAIYNRHGARLHYESNVLVNNMFGWDGRRGQELVVPQVLVFIADIAFSDGTTRQVTGDLTIIR